ncbi:MAG: hypothetical protein F6K39_09665 [Okeania sp. SIO3B3]|nr:hypothetical protein [Okeania sp. SIO3B3]
MIPSIMSGSIGVISVGSRGDRERFGNGACDGTFFYTELNGFDIISCPVKYF